MKNWEIKHLNLLQLSVRAHGAASRCSQRSDKPIGNWHDQLMTDPSTCCDYHAANLQGMLAGHCGRARQTADLSAVFQAAVNARSSMSTAKLSMMITAS